ncbi:aminotransferase class V-fold PLP-dependent enzyme [Rhodohalobacter sp.]|uniref:aminotransferase class V-fold PLP-dependent enzyme n=1 Tax=Rhodohalobacter sp. TaxID=1974210 RepID=UPI003563EE67
MSRDTIFSESELTEIRENFPHTKTERVYLNHAAISPISWAVKQAIEKFISDRHSGKIDNIEMGMSILQETRDLISGFVHAESTEQITFMSNTSEGITAVAEGLDWNEGDEILLNHMEFPTNVQPYRILDRFGVNVRYIEPVNNRVTPGMVESAISSNTRLFSISAVQYLTGFKADLEAIGAICKKHNILFVVDAIQYLGAGTIDVQACNIDALSAGGHKWLMSPMGTGFLYLSEKLSKQLKPYKTGWLSVQEPWELSNFDQKWLPVSQHLEIGTPNMIGFAGMNASLKTLNSIGLSRITENILNLTDYLTVKLSQQNNTQLISPKEREERAGIVTFTTTDITDTEAFVETLKKKNITISSREGKLRIAPHFYNTIEELDTVLNALI